MWFIQLGVNEEKPKHHYLIDNISACNKITITSDDYVKYQESPKEEEVCKSCLKELAKIKQKMMFA